MVHKSPLRLFLVGVVLLASPAATAFVPYFWAPATIFVSTGIYLMIWASLGQGYWCRQCKKFNLLPPSYQRRNPRRSGPSWLALS